MKMRNIVLKIVIIISLFILKMKMKNIVYCLALIIKKNYI